MNYKDRVYYQLLTYAFSDSNGDGIGDFQGVKDRLKYLKDLGVGGIWLSPIHKTCSYHGYDVVDYYSTNPDFEVDGYTLQDLIKDAKSMDIAIMLDMVINHTSIEHEWFQSSVRYHLGLSTDDTYKDYYMFSDYNPNKKGWYEYSLEGKTVWYYAAFSHHMPDLNYCTDFDYDRDPVFLAMLDVFRHYMDMGVRAFRLDGVRHIYEIDHDAEDVPATRKYLVALMDKLRAIDKDVFVLGEAYAKDERISGFAIGLDSIINFPVASQLKNILNNAGDIINYAKQIQSGCKRDDPEFTLSNLISSHDEGIGRYSVTVSSDIDKLYMGAAINILISGVPIIYYGDEIGLVVNMERFDHSYDKHYVDCAYRTPMPWDTLPVSSRYIVDTVEMDGHKLFNVCDTQDTVYHKLIKDILLDKSTLYYFYKDLIDIRNKYSDLFYHGTLTDVYTNWTQSKIFYFNLSRGDKSVGVIINISSESTSFDIGRSASIVFSKGNTSDTATISGTSVNIPKASVVVLEYT